MSLKLRITKRGFWFFCCNKKKHNKPIKAIIATMGTILDPECNKKRLTDILFVKTNTLFIGGNMYH